MVVIKRFDFTHILMLAESMKPVKKNYTADLHKD